MEILDFQAHHFDKVNFLLQELSSFLPDKALHCDLSKAFMDNDKCVGLVAMEQGKVVGFVSLFLYQRIRGGFVGYIEDVVVAKDNRGKKIGKELMVQIERRARRLGCYKISLECRDFNLAFYESCGFELSGNAMTKMTIKTH